LREYLTRFAFANATWTDLIEMLDRRTSEDLAAWSRVWVDEPGRPTIDTVLESRNGKISRLAFSQSDPRGRSLVWNQTLQVALGYDHGARITTLKMNGASVDVPRVGDLPLPHYVLPNSEGIGYGLFKLDDTSRQFFLAHLPAIGDSLTRGTVWVTLWDDMLEGGTTPRRLFDLMLAALPEEHEELTAERILGYVRTSFWRFLTDAERTSVAARLEQVLRAGMKQAATTSLKSAYFGAFRQIVTTPEGLAYLERVWRRREPIPGLTFAENDYIDMAQELALRDVKGSAGIWTNSTEHHQSRPQGPIRVRHAGAVIGRGGTRCVLREPREGRQPRAGTMGGRRSGLYQSPAPPSPRRTVHSAWPRAAERHSAHGRHLLSAELDGWAARGPQLAGGRADR
jgi:aminopeptidase N